MGDIWRAPIIVSRLQLSAWREQSKAGAMKARLRPSFAAGPVRNVRTSRFGTWLRSGKTLGRLRRCGITLLLRCYGVAARMRNARTDVAEQAFGLEIADLRVFAPSLDIGRGPSVPGLESVRIVLSHLLLGGEAIGELVEDQVGVNRCHPSRQHNEHPFHLASPFAPGEFSANPQNSARCGYMARRLRPATKP